MAARLLLPSPLSVAGASAGAWAPDRDAEMLSQVLQEG
jgi:hypothetical protein